MCVLAIRSDHAICDADDVGSSILDRTKSRGLRRWRTGVNGIFAGNTSRYEYLCTLYDLTRALEKSGESATSRGHRICAVECKYVLKYIERERE